MLFDIKPITKTKYVPKKKYQHSTREIVISWGGGTQSIAIGCLIAQGRLPRPSCIVMADTGRECSETLEYHERYVKPLLASVGLEVEIAGHELARSDLYSTNGSILMPVFLPNHGRLPGFCSSDWKKEVVTKYLLQKGFGRRRAVITWLGISLDEINRVKAAGVGWQQLGYPLLYDIEPAMTRDDCKRLIKEMGFPEPPKSRCYMCLAGETEVVTRDGIRRISEIAGTSQEILVPSVGKLGGLSERGYFKACPISSYGKQKLWNITLRQGKEEKIIRATADHRWILTSEAEWKPIEHYYRTTETLRVGDRLRQLSGPAITKEFIMPLGIWTVTAVDETDQIEDVYCATVDGIGAFGLSGDIMTGNCPHQHYTSWQRLKDKYPEDWAKAVALDEELRLYSLNRGGKPVYLYDSRTPLATAILHPTEKVGTLFPEDTDLTEACESGYCFT